MVNEILKEELATGVHALSIQVIRKTCYSELLRIYEPARRFRSSSYKWRFAIEPYNLKTLDSCRAFSVIAPQLWNDLPMAIRSIDDINIFKSKLKTFRFKQAYAL